MYKESLEKIVSCLMSDSETQEEYRDKILLCETLGSVCEGNVSGIDYALVKMIKNIYKIKVGTNDKNIYIPQESLERILSTSIQNIVYEEQFDMAGEILREGLAFDLSIPKDVDDAINYFYGQLQETIDSIYDSEVNLTQANLELDTLKNSIIDVILRKGMIEQGRLYNKEGLEASLEFAREYMSKISSLQQINTTGEINTDDVLIVSDYAQVKRFQEANRGRVRELFASGFKPFDDKFSFMSNDIIVVVAGINVGKTRFMIDQAYKCIMSGKNCTIVCTETPKSEVLFKLVSMHMYHVYGYNEITSSKVRTIESTPEEERGDLQTLLDQYEYCLADLANNKKYGCVSITETLYYEDCYNFFVHERQVNNKDVIFIDHVRSLQHKGNAPNGQKLITEKESLKYLSECMKDVRKNYNLMFYCFAHLKSSYSDGASEEKIGNNTNLTAGATEISESATRIFMLSQTNDDIVNDFVRIKEMKTREESKYQKSLLLMRTGASGVHVYDEEMQTSGNEEYFDLEDLIEE